MVQGGCLNKLEHDLACTKHLVSFEKRKDPEVASRVPIHSDNPPCSILMSRICFAE